MYDSDYDLDQFQCDNPLFDESPEYYEGEDYNTWEENQVFLDMEGERDDYGGDYDREDLGWDGGMED